MQKADKEALRKCTRLITESLNLETHPQILSDLYEREVLWEEDVDNINRHLTPVKQTLELLFRLKRCDATRSPFAHLCAALHDHGHPFISQKLKETRSTMGDVQEHEKCTYCTLLEDLYPDRVAPGLYEDSGLSSGTLEEVTLTEGVTRRAAVQILLKKVVQYQKEAGPGRECIDRLANALPGSCDHLRRCLDKAAVEDLIKCGCPSNGELCAKVKVKGRENEVLSEFEELMPLGMHTRTNGLNGLADATNGKTDIATALTLMTLGQSVIQGQVCDLHTQTTDIQGQPVEAPEDDSDCKTSSHDDKDDEQGTDNCKGQAHLTQGHVQGQNGYHPLKEQEKVMQLVTSPRNVRVGPSRDHRNIVAICGEMDELISEGLWEEFQAYTNALRQKHPDSVDVQLNILHHTVFSHCVQNTVTDATRGILGQSKQLINKSSCPTYFEIDYLGMLSKVLRKQKQFGVVQCCMDCIYQKSELLLPEKIVTLALHRDAEYLIHQFQTRFLTGSVPENIIQKIERGFLSCIEQSTRVRDYFRKSHITVKYADDCYVSGRRCHIHLALLYLRCCVTGEGMNENYEISPEEISKAQQSLKKVVEEWEGISSRTRAKYLLARSDLHFRSKDYEPALTDAYESFRICERRRFGHMAGWARKRIQYLEARVAATVGCRERGRLNPGERDDTSSGCEAGMSSGPESS